MQFLIASIKLCGE